MGGSSKNRKSIKLHVEEGEDWHFQVKNPIKPEKEVIITMDPCVSAPIPDHIDMPAQAATSLFIAINIG